MADRLSAIQEIGAKSFAKLVKRQKQVYAVVVGDQDNSGRRMTDSSDVSTVVNVRSASAKVAESLSEAFKAQVLLEFVDVFPNELPMQLPPADRSVHVEHAIELLPGSSPVKQRYFRKGEKELKEIKRIIEDMLASRIIRPSVSPWASPVLLAPKPDGTWRFCVDYRALNKLTKKNSYPFANIQECLDRLRDAKFFTSMDLRSGYHQVRMEEGSVEKTAFTTRYGNYEFMVMPFGLCNAPATFQTLMNSIFQEDLDSFVIVYLDDILVFSKTLEQHRNHVKKVLETLRRNKLYCKLSKCQFARQTIDFVGYTVSQNTVAMQSDKLRAIREWPRPSTVKMIQRFLGFCNYYRRFIRNFAVISAPLVKVTAGGKKAKFYWETEQESAFDELKTVMCREPVLHIPDMSGSTPFILQTDASAECIGSVLSQNGKIVDCFSHKLNEHQLNYDIRDKELLAVVMSLDRWDHYCSNTTVTVYTDHQSLKYIDMMKVSAPKQQRQRVIRWWADILCRYNLTWIYKPGQFHIAPDALSRMYCVDRVLVDSVTTTSAVGGADGLDGEESSRCLQAQVVVQPSEELLAKLIENYGEDPDWKPFLEAKTGTIPTPTNGMHRLRFERTRLDETTGMLYYRSSKDADERLVIPKGDVRNMLLHEHHTADISGHLNFKRQKLQLSRRYW